MATADWTTRRHTVHPGEAARGTRHVVGVTVDYAKVVDQGGADSLDERESHTHAKDSDHDTPAAVTTTPDHTHARQHVRVFTARRSQLLGHGARTQYSQYHGTQGTPQPLHGDGVSTWQPCWVARRGRLLSI